jgi:glycosyltransferase involved in cell wall biosynthesis
LNRWLCSHLGARERYAIPRALFRQGSLCHLVTDAWVPPSSFLAKVGRRSNLGERFHHELSNAPVTSFNASLTRFETLARVRHLSGWARIIARNNWFQKKVVKALQDYVVSSLWSGGPPTLFSYSYAAREIFAFAKLQGWKTVLGQIDPGPVEEGIVAAEAEREASLIPRWRRAPADYWKSWREESDLADRIIVNSQWSFDALVKMGIPREKLLIIPLAFQNNVKSVSLKTYPGRFTAERPLRVLFLGQINLRKGIARLLNAARSFQSEPVEFLMVGPVQINVPEGLRSSEKIRWVGPVAPKNIQHYYEQADVFILPTLSDGFALTQLEALAHRLPVIASRRCGDVVIDRVNGLLLEEPTAEAIQEALRSCLDNPDQLAQFSQNATIGERFSLSCLGTSLCTLGA